MLVGEKRAIESAIDECSGARKPSVAFRTKAALAWVAPLRSHWTAGLLLDHARSLGAAVAFFGDLDPQTLHWFAALRARGRDALFSKAPYAPVQWIGLDSEWLDWICAQTKTADVPLAMLIRLKWLDGEYLYA